jgi:hypothetical protein
MRPTCRPALASGVRAGPAVADVGWLAAVDACPPPPHEMARVTRVRQAVRRASLGTVDQSGDDPDTGKDPSLIRLRVVIQS